MSVDPKKSMNSHSGHVIGKVNKLRKFMEEKQDGLTGLTRKRAETLMNEVTDMYSSMETKWLTFTDEVQTKDGNLYKELSTKLKDCSKMADDVVADVTKMMKDYDASQAPSTNASPNESSTPKAPLKQDNSYKPGILLSSNNLEEFNAWQSTFEAHHDKNATWLLRL